MRSTRAWHRGNYKTSSNSVMAFDENGAGIGVVFQTAKQHFRALVERGQLARRGGGRGAWYELR